MFFKTGMWKNTHPSGQKGHHGTHGTSEGPMSDVPFFVWAYPGHKLCPFEGMTGLMPFDLAFWPNTGRRGISGQLVGHHEGQRRPNGPLPPPSPRVYLAESVCPRNIDTAENYTSVQRSQHITQADLRVFGQSYLANCSSVDGQAAFLGELSDHRHIEYFQSIERFWEPGLPHELPARVETS
jgi:hypothetical protein